MGKPEQWGGAVLSQGGDTVEGHLLAGAGMSSQHCMLLQVSAY